MPELVLALASYTTPRDTTGNRQRGKVLSEEARERIGNLHRGKLVFEVAGGVG